LYTGDLGFKDAAGLHLTGREKWVIKSFGYLRSQIISRINTALP
jgi:acyl-CoA synthetase (AMP-forming)/AMP-acid ligase II